MKLEWSEAEKGHDVRHLLDRSIPAERHEPEVGDVFDHVGVDQCGDVRDGIPVVDVIS